MPLKSGCFDLFLCNTIAVELDFPWCKSTSLNFPSVRTGTKAGAKMTPCSSTTGAPSGTHTCGRSGHCPVPQSDGWGKGFGRGLSDAPVHVLPFLREKWVWVRPFPTATRYVRGVGAHRSDLQEVVNPWGKIPNPCNAVGHACAPEDATPLLAACPGRGELPPAQCGLAEVGSRLSGHSTNTGIYRVTRGDPMALGPAAPLATPRQ